MRIKFKAPDPRAGTVVQMDSRRGQELIDAGSATLVKDDGSDGDAKAAAAPAPARVAAPAPAAKTGKGKK